MPTSPSYQRFFAELKRRHVFRMVAVYGVVGFVVLQVVDLAVPALLLPDWTYRLVALLVFVGFPIAVLITWAFEITPDGVRRTRAAEPGELEAIVAQPAGRRWPAGLFALAGLVLLSGGWWLGRHTGPQASAAAPGSDRPSALEARLALPDPEADTRPSIAVLPFLDMSEQGDQAYFSDGITEELLDVLTRLRALRVAARTSAFAFRDQKLTASQLGDTLGVEYLLEGSVRKAGDELRITAQLIDVEDGSHIWSKTYDRKLEAVFAIQSEIARAIADSLRVSLGLEPQELVHPTADLEAYDLYLAGRAKVRERGAALSEAVRLFEAAIARDSSWAPAWAGLAETYEVRQYYPASWDRTPADDESRLAIVRGYQDEALRAGQRALALDPNNASARVALGSVYRTRHQWEDSEREYLEALSLDPDDPEVHQQYADLLISTGRVADAVVTGRRAVLLDAAPIRLSGLATAEWADGRHEEALETLRRAIAADPGRNLHWTVDNWYVINMVLRRFEDAVRFGLPSGEGYLRVSSARHDELVDVLQGRGTRPVRSATPEESLLMLAIGQALDDPGIALTGMEDFLELYPYATLGWLWIPELDSVRDHPRYRAVLRSLNLEGMRPRRTGNEAGAEH